MVQRCRLAAAGEEQLAEPVVVAVERSHAAADEVLEVTGVPMVDGAGLLDEAGRGDHRWSSWRVASGDRHRNGEGDCDRA